MPEGKTIQINLLDAQKIVYALRAKQDYYRVGDYEAKGYEVTRQIVDELERLKMGIVKQM